MSFVLIDLTKFAAEIDFGQLTNEVQKWCYVIKNMWRLQEGDIPMEETVFRELYENCKISKLNAMEKQEYEKSVLEYEDVKDAMEYHHRMGFAEGVEKGLKRGRKEGMKEGMKEGIEKGRKKGIEEGMEKGMEKGKEETQRQMVINMLENGLSIATIAKISGLSEEKVKAMTADN